MKKVLRQKRMAEIPREVRLLSEIPSHDKPAVRQKISDLYNEMRTYTHPICPHCALPLEEVVVVTSFGERLYWRQCPGCHYAQDV